ncbi:hypothetical protein ACJJTC_011128 [Scirpophaga incertulas]
MAQTNSNSTMEMGTSDQVLVASKKKKTVTYVIGAIAMVIAAVLVIVLVLVLGGNKGGNAEPIISTTSRPPTSPITTTTTTTKAPTTAGPPVTEPGTSDDSPFDLESIINGDYTVEPFNGTWTQGNDILYKNDNGDLILYDIDSASPVLLISNTSQILQQSARVSMLSSDSSVVILAYNVDLTYRHSFLARYSAINYVTGTVTDIQPPGVNSTDALLQNFIWGPTGTALAYVFENNIYYQSSITSDPLKITSSGVVDVVYNGIPDWVYEEEVFASNNAMWFSADGSRLAYATFNDKDVRLMKVPHYGVPGSTESQYTKHRDIRYPKSGTTNPTVSLTLRDLASEQQSVYEAPTDLNEPILKLVKFVSNNAIAVMWTNRVQTQMSVYLCQFQGTCNQIYSYSEPKGWIDNIPMLFNAAGNAFITILPQAVDGVLYKQVVQILSWTTDDVVWYKATHVNDTAQQHIYKSDASRQVICFTCDIRRPDGEACLYNEATLTQDASYISVHCAGPNVPQTFIYKTDGTFVMTWEDNAGISARLANHTIPQTLRITLPTADIQLQVPDDYLNRRNVPLLVYVYGGPDTALVTKQWSIDWGTSLVARWGIAIAHIDGRGSGLRGVGNMFAVNRQLGTVEIEDQIHYTRCGNNCTWLDANRTCIWGWSYGGYASSLALARGGGAFRCAAAVAPVADWRYYDTIYTERYMGLPQENPVGYAQSSLLSLQVAELFRDKRYFLIHGTADDNVHYQHAMLISRLLQRQDVAFTQMSYTDEDHAMIGVRPHLYHSLERFLKENML